MRVLGVDTSSLHASVAVLESGRLLAELTEKDVAESGACRRGSRNNHAEIVLPLIEASLERAQCTLREIDGFAVTIGPGSFTGLRIGLSTVKGLACGTDIPVVGVSTLHAAAARIGDRSDFVCAMLDARKHEVYASIFRTSGPTIERLTDDRVASVDELAGWIRRMDLTGRLIVTGDDGVRRQAKALGDVLDAAISFAEDGGLPTLAASAAVIADALFPGCRGVQLAALVPQYLRRSEAESRVVEIG